MADRSRLDDAAVTKIVVEVVDRLSDRLADATSAVHKTLELEIGELRGDPQLLDLMHASVEENIATILDSIHHGIPIEHVESPTAGVGIRQAVGPARCPQVPQLPGVPPIPPIPQIP